MHWLQRIVTTLVSAGLYTLSATLLKDTSAADPVMVTAGIALGLLGPQLGVKK